MAYEARIVYVALIIAFCISAQSALGLAVPLRGMALNHRKLLVANAAVLSPEPKYQGLPLCTSQRTADGKGWLHGRDAALAAWQLSNGERWAAISEIDYCEGTESSSKTTCQGGDGVYTHFVFEDLSCYTKPRCQTNPDGTSACVGRK